MAAVRANARAADLTFDALYPEAWLLAAVGDTAAALTRLKPTLDVIGLIPVKQFAKAIDAGALLQAMVLRGSLSSRTGDRKDGRLWARAVVALTDTSLAVARQARRAAIDDARF